MSSVTDGAPVDATSTPSADRSAPTRHRALLAWVDEVTALTTPDAVHWLDGSAAEAEQLAARLVDAGTLIPLDPVRHPHSFAARTDPDDVARVEDRTFICSVRESDAGPTNNWRDPEQMRAELTALYRGSMRGRTMYVIPFSMGAPDSANPIFGVEITDSGYVALSMRIMARVGIEVLDAMGTDAPFVPCLHSVGAPLEPGQADVPWPCNDTKYIVQFPEDRTIWSYGSGYGGNSLLGKKCLSLRIASVMARDEGWLAEHMLILKLTSPRDVVHYVAAAFPSACGKTNLAMLEPTLPGWRAETIGDDIAWMRFGDDGRLYAENPEAGLFGVAPGTGWETNPNAMRAIEAGHTVFTNVGLTDDDGVWWEGMTAEAPERLTDWRGQPWTPADGSGDDARPAAHPNSRFCTPIDQLPTLAPEYRRGQAVPISAILFGGRRRTTVPLVVQATSWEHGVLMGATTGSETTAAATGTVGVVRRDPMAMLPFLGYDAGDHLAHWLSLDDDPAHRLPAVFQVNWFRRDDDGGFLWPGFGENTRVLAWVVDRLEGRASGVESPIGVLPAPGELDLDGLGPDPEAVRAAVAAATRFDPDEWAAELPGLRDWFEHLGPTVPRALHEALDRLADALR